MKTTIKIHDTAWFRTHCRVTAATIDMEDTRMQHKQNCDLSDHLTEEMNKYPKGSPERALLKSIRFGIAYGRQDSTINISRDYSPEEMMTRFKAMFAKEAKE